MKAKTIIALVIVALLLIVAFQNMQVVSLHLLFWEVTASQLILIPAVLMVGVVLGYVLGRVGRKK
jgi:uncharacterized integral membrane protein